MWDEKHPRKSIASIYKLKPVLTYAIILLLMSSVITVLPVSASSIHGQETHTGTVSQDQGPTAKCTLSTNQISPGETVEINASASREATYYEYDKDGDGNFDTDALAKSTINFTYNEEGEFSPAVRAYENSQNFDTDTCGTLTVTANQNPNASFAYTPSSPASDQAVEFDASSSTDPDGEIVQYSWDFDGDNTVDATTETPQTSFTYPSQGEYSVGLEVTDDDGATDRATQAVRVEESNEFPVVDFAFDPAIAEPGEEVVFEADVSDSDGTISKLVWRVNGKAVAESRSFSRAFEEHGSYVVSLTVEDDDGYRNRHVEVVIVRGEVNPPENSSYPIMPFGTPTQRGEVAPTNNVSYTIPFQSGDFRPAKGLDESLLQTPSNTVHALVLFNHGDADKEIEQLRTFGYEYEETITTNAHYATIPKTNLNAVQNLGFVRSITRIRPGWKLRPEFKEEARQKPSVSTTVLTFGDVDHPQLEKLGPDVYRGELTAQQIDGLQDNPKVMWLEQHQRPRPSTAEGRDIVNAPSQAQGNSPDITGAGVEVGVIDSGIRNSHRHFTGVNIDETRDWTGPPSDMNSTGSGTCDHGTHVAGTITGSGVDNSRNKRVTGVAPGSGLVISRIFETNSSDGSCTLSQYNLYRSLYNNVNREGADIISNSWGSNSGGDYDWGARASDRWMNTHPNTLLVFANGNYPDTSHVDSPGIAKNVLTVGAVKDGSYGGVKGGVNGQVNRTSVMWTEGHSTLNDMDPPDDVRFGSSGRTVPDVLAPGENITSSIRNDAYGEKSGTSMATPHVSGVAALYLSAVTNYRKRGSVPATEMKAAIVGTTREPIGPNANLGFGVVDAQNAMGNNSYEYVQGGAHGTINQGQTQSGTFNVPSDSKKVIVTLVWSDPKGSPVARNKVMRNDLALYVGPKNNPRKYDKDTWPTNVKKVVIDQPYGPNNDRSGSSTTWKWTVEGKDVGVPFEPTEDYTVIYRVVQDEPEIHVDAPQKVSGNATETFNGTFEVSGEGAPMGVFYKIRTERGLELCGAEAGVIGALHEGEEVEEQICFKTSNVGTYKATLFVMAKAGGTTLKVRKRTIEVLGKENRPPQPVPNIRSPTHQRQRINDQWSGDPDIEFEWDKPSDRGVGGTSSGVAGYYTVLDTTSSRTKAAVLNGGVLHNPASFQSVTKTAFDSGEHYFHILAYDDHGNNGPVSTVGPYKVDLEPPEDIKDADISLAPVSTEKTVGGDRVGYTNNSTLTFTWKSTTDNHSGLAGYNVSVIKKPCASSNQYNCATENVTVNPGNRRVQVTLNNGSYMFSVRPFDKVDNIKTFSGTYDFVVDQTPPSARLEMDAVDPEAQTPVQFNASKSFDSSGAIERYIWEFPDGTRTTTTEPTISHQFPSNNTYQVNVTVVDSAGNRDTRSREFKINSQETPGFGILVALLALLFAVAIYRRRA